MDVAVVGCGAIAEEYGPELAATAGVDPVAAADRAADRAAAFADAHGGEPFDDADAMLAAAGPDLVVNLTGHAAHAPVTRAALRAGAHVYSEKPLALDPGTARDLRALAAERGRRLGCAPHCHLGDAQREAVRYLREGRLGPVRHAAADCHIGRLADWHGAPAPFRRAGPLLDGGVYPLTFLTACLGPVARVAAADRRRHLATLDRRRADADDPLDGPPDGVPDDPAPDHVVAVLEFAAGPTARLTASSYVRHRTRRHNAVELHGDDGSLFVRNCGETVPTDEPPLSFGRAGGAYRPVRPIHEPRPLGPAAGVRELVDAIREDRPARVDAGRAAHVVAVAAAIRGAADGGGPVAVEPPDGTIRTETEPWSAAGGRRPTVGRTGGGTPDRRPGSPPTPLPPIGFGRSRYRGDGEYVDLGPATEAALDAGYRLFDSAELYGNEGALGDLLARRGSPDREAVYLLSKLWNTNHRPEHVREACETTLAQLGVDSLDCYMLHWPDAWAYQGPLTDLAALPHDAAQARTFPTDADGEPAAVDVPLADTWAAMEALVADGLVDALGASNLPVARLDDLLAAASVPPAVVQFERHPYRPNRELVAWCREHGAVPMAHSPLSAPGLLREDAVRTVADAHDVTPAQAVLRWNVEAGVVPIPSTSTPGHAHENRDVFRFSLTDADRDRLDGLTDPDFER